MKRSVSQHSFGSNDHRGGQEEHGFQRAHDVSRQPIVDPVEEEADGEHGDRLARRGSVSDNGTNKVSGTHIVETFRGLHSMQLKSRTRRSHLRKILHFGQEMLFLRRPTIC